MLKTKPFHNNRKFIQLFTLLFIICLYIPSYIPQAYAVGKSYIKCWENSDGITECGNRIPREYYNQRIRFIDGRGITRDIKEKAKTREELEAAQEAAKKEQAGSHQHTDQNTTKLNPDKKEKI